MKIVNDSNNTEPIDLNELIEESFQKYNSVFFSEIDDQLFIYRPLGRKEYKDILGNENLDEWDKQDAICKAAIIYPKDFDFEYCPAGIPDQLSQDIIEKSCLDPESMLYLLYIHRQEAEQLGSEMVCIIAEAFPAYTVDEIESWDNLKFMKIYAQAEWILKNIRNVQFQVDIADYLAEISGVTDEELIQMGFKEEQPQPQHINHQEEAPVRQPRQETTQPKQQGKMSAEQRRAYEEFVRQHPEFADAMQYDSAFTGFETQTADTVNPALRPGWYHNR